MILIIRKAVCGAPTYGSHLNSQACMCLCTHHLGGGEMAVVEVGALPLHTASGMSDQTAVNLISTYEMPGFR